MVSQLTHGCTAQAVARAAAVEAGAVALSRYQAETDADEVDLGLVASLLQYICAEGKHNAQRNAPSPTRPPALDAPVGAGLGAVLIFLPGEGMSLHILL